MDLLRCPACLRRFLVQDAGRSGHGCPACGGKLQLMVRSIPGPANRAASALGAEILSGPILEEEGAEA